MFSKDEDGTCVHCNANCDSCKGPKENECLTCFKGAILKDGKCTCSAGMF